MTFFNRFSLIASAIILFSCGTTKSNSDNFDISTKKKENSTEIILASEMIDLENKGVGSIKNLPLDENIDSTLIHDGKRIFETKCTACHRMGEVFLGPDLFNVLNRRSPEWVMNMILNPDLMVKEDTLAQLLFLEFKGYPMTNQGLSQKEARALVEFFRSTSSE